MVVKARLGQIEDEAHILPFLFQTLRNCVGNYYQKARTEQKYIDFSAETERGYEPDGVRDWHDVLEKALGRLSQAHQKCVALLRAVMRSAETDELKKLLNTDESNVYRTLYRCRNRLKEIITQDMKVKLP